MVLCAKTHVPDTVVIFITWQVRDKTISVDRWQPRHDAFEGVQFYVSSVAGVSAGVSSVIEFFK